MLLVENLSVAYGPIVAVRDVSLRVEAGKVVALIGANGAGKSSILRAVSGLAPVAGGGIRLCGEDLKSLSAAQRVERGLAHCPEGRKIFGQMTVLENLQIGGFPIRRSVSAKDIADRIESLLQTFPVLKEKLSHLGSTLSGGEQQMLAMARALVMKPKFLLLDEPMMGLAPKIIKEVLLFVEKLAREEAVGILLVEQMANKALDVADEAYVLEQGQMMLSGSAKDLKNNPLLKKAYLGA